MISKVLPLNFLFPRSFPAAWFTQQPWTVGWFLLLFWGFSAILRCWGELENINIHHTLEGAIALSNWVHLGSICLWASAWSLKEGKLRKFKVAELDWPLRRRLEWMSALSDGLFQNFQRIRIYATAWDFQRQYHSDILKKTILNNNNNYQFA